ncbi:Electron transport complex protein RnfC [hydrothermal vent metagenome]|uniref:Electron transport complex protein RnfC n=1 Tax=hydrothermal vent metagenome TaxID=652676 RepID=A0A3B0ZAB9_9ZZZZ
MTELKRLNEFHGGLILEQHKQLSTRNKIQQAEIPEQLTIPLQQHIGLPAQATVVAGEQVKKGQVLAQEQGYVSSPIHAPTSGTIIDICKQPTLHPSGMMDWCILLKPDHKDEWLDNLPKQDNYKELSPDQLRHKIHQAGIVGLGGATFPSHIKLQTEPACKINHLIINAAECEPWISCDDALVRERASEIIQGIRIIMHILNVSRCTIALEQDMSAAKAQLIDAIDSSHQNSSNNNSKLCNDDEPILINIAFIPVIYPAGGEKQLIKIITNKEVPSHGLPRDLGIVCHNVGTSYAIYRAIILGQPLISRIVTVTGNGVKDPCNVEALIGTPVEQLLLNQEAILDEQHSLVIGGPMMGFEINNQQLPLTKACNCLLLNKKKPPAVIYPCIRCGACAEVCPAKLLPQQLFWYAQAQDLDRVQDYQLFDCIECGCCSYVCPSNIPLVQYYRYAKTEIWKQDKEKRKSDIARERHEVRNERIARQKREIEERRRKKKEALRKSKGEQTTEDPKKAAIQAALERVRNKQKNSPVQPKNKDQLTQEQQQSILDADQRRKQINRVDKK